MDVGFGKRRRRRPCVHSKLRQDLQEHGPSLPHGAFTSFSSSYSEHVHVHDIIRIIINI